MIKRVLQIYGIYQDLGKIHFSDKSILEWRQISGEMPPQIPYGTPIEIEIQFENRDYLNGSEGIVWATYDIAQAEIVHDALLSQNIACAIEEEKLQGRQLHLLRIPEAKDVQAAIDFIWRDTGGLRLQPDWAYPVGKENESLKKWIDGN